MRSDDFSEVPLNSESNSFDGNNYGTVSGSGTGPLDNGATGPVPDTEPRL